LKLMELFINETGLSSGGCDTETGTANFKKSPPTTDWHGAQKKLGERLQARDGNFLEVVRRGENLTFVQWVDFFLENYSKPPVRELRTHEANLRAAKHLKLAFATRRLIDVMADDIELFIRERLPPSLIGLRGLQTADNGRNKEAA